MRAKFLVNLAYVLPSIYQRIYRAIDNEAKLVYQRFGNDIGEIKCDPEGLYAHFGECILEGLLQDYHPELFESLEVLEVDPGDESLGIPESLMGTLVVDTEVLEQFEGAEDIDRLYEYLAYHVDEDNALGNLSWWLPTEKYLYYPFSVLEKLGV